MDPLNFGSMGECQSCGKASSTLECGLCKEALCKNCAEFLEAETLAFLKPLPEDLSHAVYCGSCYAKTVAPALESYSDTLEKAKNVFVYLKKQGKETRLLKRTAPPVQVLDCPDYDETLLRLAFLAVQDQYNAIIDVDITSEKVRHGGYQTLKWQGRAVPTHIDPRRAERN